MYILYIRMRFAHLCSLCDVCTCTCISIPPIYICFVTVIDDNMRSILQIICDHILENHTIGHMQNLLEYSNENFRDLKN